MFDTPVSDCVALVVKPNDDRYGQFAEIESHDWKESGRVYVRFKDGVTGDYRDGKCSGDPLPEVLILVKGSEEMETAGGRIHLIRGILRKFDAVQAPLEHGAPLRDAMRVAMATLVYDWGVKSS